MQDLTPSSQCKRPLRLDTVPADKPDLGCLSSSKKWNQSRVERKEDSMYIGGGVLTLIVIILLLIWLL